MSSSNGAPKLDACGCCGAEPSTIAPVNRPGLPALAYRIGTYATFLRRMLYHLHQRTVPPGSNTRPLEGLTTRSLDDPAIALLDASATAADVLTFYQERIANEGFLRTATERRSVLELARAIGYELSPGVAASTFLAFTVQGGAGAPGPVVVPQGTKVQSVPAQGKLPQTFETVEDIQVRPEWNEIKPLQTYAQPIAAGMNPIYVKGTNTNLKPGDRLLIVASAAGSGVVTQAVVVDAIETDSKSNQTRVHVGAIPAARVFAAARYAASRVPVQAVGLTADTVDTLAQSTLTSSQVNAILEMNNWAGSAFVAAMDNWQPPPPPAPARDPGVFALRAHVGFFGYNAPKWASLPASQRTAEWVVQRKNDGSFDKYVRIDPAYPKSWDGAQQPSIWKDSQGNNYDAGKKLVYLERAVPQLLSNSWAIFESGTLPPAAYYVTSVAEQALADYGLSGKAAGLRLEMPDPQAAFQADEGFRVRETTASVQSEKLDLAELPLETPLAQGSDEILVEGTVLYLKVGQSVALTGKLTYPPGVAASEVVILRGITYGGGHTRLQFQNGLANSYVLSTVTLNANTARATHGETVREVLGSGSAAVANQRFMLKKPPLTYVSAPTPTGAQSTLAVRVNGVLWDEAPALYGLGPRDTKYIVRLDDSGATTVTGGDGVAGARWPSGQENIAATYRSGIGPDGEVDAGSLTLLQTKPLGIRGVTNPVAASGAAAPEHLDHARVNAPLTVLTLGRIVSREDYEDFARAFAGIGKAQAVELWDGESRLIHITVAAAGGGPVDPTSALYRSLVQAIATAHDPVQIVRVASYLKLQFNLTASVQVDPRYVAGDVLTAVDAALKFAFSFQARGFAQPVTAAEVVTAIQTVGGVIATDLSQLYLSIDPAGPAQIEPPALLPAVPARFDAGVIAPAQLLLLNPAGLTLTLMLP